MEVLFSVPLQTRTDLAVSVPLRTRRRVGTRSIELWVTINSGAGTLNCRIDWEFPDGAAGSTSGTFSEPGLHKIGFWRGGDEAGDVRLGGEFQVIGRKRFSAEIVALDQGEDVPEA